MLFRAAFLLSCRGRIACNICDQFFFAFLSQSPTSDVR